MSSVVALRRAAPAALLAAALAAIAFGADGGLQLEPATIAGIAVIVVGGGLCVAAIVRAGTRAPVHGIVGVALMAALAAFTALSIAWALEPSDAWVESGRTLSYLFAFAGAVALARLLPGRSAAVVGSVLLSALALCGYALLTKVFPAALAEAETYARLREPFGYWNAVGLAAALAAPPCLWLGTRREGHPAARAAAYPALALLIVTALLSYSRGSLLAVAIGSVFWLATVPRRLRALVLLAIAGTGAALVVAWTFGQQALSEDRVPLAARNEAGHELGLLLLLMIVLLWAAGLLADLAAERRPARERTRRRIGKALLAGLALSPVVVLVALAASPGGVGGNVSGAWGSLTDPDARTPANDPGRLTATGSVRARYWREALHVFAEHAVAGAGAGAYATARTRYRRDQLEVLHAHGYVVQVLADLGLVGLALSLALLAAWLAGAARATGLRRRDRGLPFDGERIALLTLSAVVVVFGVHSLLDWTWFVPGTAVVALLCAGWVVAQGPLGPRPATAGPAPWPRFARPAAAAALAGLALLAAYATWQPLRAVRAGHDALAQLAAGDAPAARAAAQRARDYDPLSIEPLFELAAIEDAAGRRAAAQHQLQQAVALQPANPEPWRRLAAYALQVRGDPRLAFEALRAAIYLDPRNARAQGDFVEARRTLAAINARERGRR